MKQHSKLAIIGLILGILAIFCFLISFFIMLFGIIMTFILGILAIIFGATAYWGRWKDRLGLTDFKIGLVVLIIWFLTWVITYTYVSGMLYGVPSYRPRVK